MQEKEQKDSQEHSQERSQEHSQELMEILVENSKKQLFYSRLGAVAMLIIAAAFLVCLVMVLPQAIAAVRNANHIMVQASDTITLADEAITSITEMSDSITAMGRNMDTFITENAEAVTDVMKKIEDIDFEGLNGAIKDLGEVIEPLARFFGKFK